MRIAYYAPLKPPDHPLPSGDRQIARALLQALGRAGHDAFVASRFRSFDAQGDRLRQARLRDVGARIAERVLARCRREPRPDLWFTYHVYHKAPDFLGPPIARALDIPYVVAEASLAPRQRDGPWSEGHAHAVAAVRRADTILLLSPADVREVSNARGPGAPCELFPPFIDSRVFTNATRDRTRAGQEVQLITVAMMRERAKLASYRMLASALASLREPPWQLTVVGDGPARADVEAAFAALRERVHFIGARNASEIASLLRASDVFAWPAIDEAIGIVFLEAQACGVPVVGAGTPGVAGVVDAGRTGLLPAAGDVAGFADALRRLLTDTELRERMGVQAAAYVRERHDLAGAAARLDAILRDVVARRAATAHAATP
jgi:glycosyltransferase involved in cell wall biosynthesis